MSSERTNELRALDRAHFWHPFTPMEAWCEPDHEAVVLEKGEGARLTDTEGRAYLDGNSSIWTNIHGHGHPRIVAAIQEQAAKLAHASTLGFTNGPSAELAAALVGLFPEGTFSRAFFSDNGSTAVECACKMALQHWQLRGKGERDTFVAFEGAYHGDTAGAASLGGIATFHGRFGRWGWTVEHCASVQELEERIEGSQIAAVVVEPVIQGAAGMRLWPEGTLRQLREWCDEKGTFLLLDEVMTGFGRLGTMFACQREGVTPDLLALAKGLTGGTLPMAATLVRESVFEPFFGGPEETFYYGHSYCGNPLGAAAALASLAVFEEEKVLAGLPAKIRWFQEALRALEGRSEWVYEVRCVGLMAGIEVRQADGTAYPSDDRVGAAICRAAREHGLLTRPILDTLVLMPPLCITEEDIELAVTALELATKEVCSSR